MNRLILNTTLAALALAAPAVAMAQQLPAAVIAVVDRDQIATTCTQCVAATQQLQAQGTAYQQREQQLTAPLNTEGQAIQTAINALPQGGQPDAALAARINAYRTNQQAAATELQGRQETIRRNQMFVVRQMTERMDPLIGQVTRSRGANIAVDISATLAHNPAVNVTADVLALMNQNNTPFNVNAPAQAPAAAQQPAAQQPQQQRRPQGR
jgi:Skp family chaperone for outer membrane proteins